MLTDAFMFAPPGSLLDFLKSDEGNRVQLPKLIDFSAQVRLPISPHISLAPLRSPILYHVFKVNLII